MRLGESVNVCAKMRIEWKKVDFDWLDKFPFFFFLIYFGGHKKTDIWSSPISNLLHVRLFLVFLLH